MSTIIDYTPIVGEDGITRYREDYTDAESALIDYLDWKAGVEDPITHAWAIVELMVKLGWRPVEELAEKARPQAEKEAEKETQS